MPRDTQPQAATPYRMVMEDHLYPFGLKARDLLERAGFAVDDNHLSSREETDAFKARHGVDTTPQVWIGAKRIGGYDALPTHLGEADPEQETTYVPVIALFGMAALMALAAAMSAFGTILSADTLRWFGGIAMCLLALQKLRDVESFSTMFLNYDLLAACWVRYGYVYPFAEALAGLLMIAMGIWMLPG